MDLRSWQGNQIALLLFSLNEIQDDTSILFPIVHLHIATRSRTVAGVALLSSSGYEQVSSPDEADVIILNSCGVKEPTEDRVISRLAGLTSSDSPIIITGCLPKISLQRIERTLPAVGAIFCPQSMDILSEVVRRVLGGERGIIHLSRDSSSKLQYFEGPPNSVVCTISICEGCLGSCTYYAVRLARGSVRSYRIEEVQRVAKRCQAISVD